MNCRPVEQRFVAEVFNKLLIDVCPLGGGWALVLSKVILLKCRTNDDRYSSAGVGGLCVGIFSSLQGWLCVGVLCALQCAKNSVGSGRQSHVSLNLSRMLFRVTYNEQVLPMVGNFIFIRRNCCLAF